MAVYCCVPVMRTVAVTGAIAMLTSVAAVTVKPVVPEMAPRAAVIATAPGLRAVASPWEPGVLLTVAMVEVVEGAQVTCVVRFRVVLSEYVPVAVNC